MNHVKIILIKHEGVCLCLSVPQKISEIKSSQYCHVGECEAKTGVSSKVRTLDVHVKLEVEL